MKSVVSLTWLRWTLVILLAIVLMLGYGGSECKKKKPKNTVVGSSVETVELPAQVTLPYPDDNAIDIPINLLSLTWTAASGATSYDVYFGTDEKTLEYQITITETDLSYVPSGLIRYTTYYWRIDFKNGSGTTQGPVWSFQTALYNAPLLAAIGNQTVTEGQLLQFTISATDPDGDTLTYSATGLPAGATFDPVTRTFSWTPTLAQVGSYPNITFRVRDD